MRKGRVLFYVIADLIAVTDGHKHIRQNQVRAHIRNFAHCGFAVADSYDVNALILQGESDHFLDVAVVVRNQDLGHRTSSDAPAHTRTAASWTGAASLSHWSIGR